MNAIPPYADSTRQSPASDPVLLAEIQQLRARDEIMRQALEEIAHASDVPPPGLTWQSRANHFRNIARAAITAAEGG